MQTLSSTSHSKNLLEALHRVKEICTFAVQSLGTSFLSTISCFPLRTLQKFAMFKSLGISAMPQRGRPF